IQSQQTAVAVSRSITERTVRWTASIFFTFLFGMLAPPDLQSATCSVGIGKIGRIIAFHDARDGTLLIGADNGLFRLAGDKLVAIGKKRDTGSIYAFHDARDGTPLINADNGLFRLAGDKLVAIGKDQDTRWIGAFHDARD